jgi:hypothetical protein
MAVDSQSKDGVNFVSSICSQRTPGILQCLEECAELPFVDSTTDAIEVNKARQRKRLFNIGPGYRSLPALHLNWSVPYEITMIIKLNLILLRLISNYDENLLSIK